MTIIGPELLRNNTNTNNSSNTAIPPNDETEDQEGKPSLLRLTVEATNATADSVYGLVDAVNRATLARVAEPAKGDGGEARASLKLGKADDVTLPWGKTLLAKPLIRLNAATLPPALAELLGRPPLPLPLCSSVDAAGAAAATTVLDGLVAWLDRALGDLIVGRRREEEAAAEGARAVAEAAVAVAVGDEVESGKEKGGPSLTGAGEVVEVAITDTEQRRGEEEEGEAAASASPSPSAPAEPEADAAAAAATTARVQRTRLVCVLETTSGGGGGFEAVKVLHQLRLYQLPHLARGLPFVGPSANPTLSAVAFNASAFMMNQRCVHVCVRAWVPQPTGSLWTCLLNYRKFRFATRSFPLF
jgi:hypothetical protein